MCAHNHHCDRSLSCNALQNACLVQHRNTRENVDHTFFSFFLLNDFSTAEFLLHVLRAAMVDENVTNGVIRSRNKTGQSSNFIVRGEKWILLGEGLCVPVLFILIYIGSSRVMGKQDGSIVLITVTIPWQIQILSGALIAL